MTDELKHELLDLINKSEDEVSQMFHGLENDESVTEESYRNAEKYIDNLFILLNKLRETVI